jgi:hypothetical protein
MPATGPSSSSSLTAPYSSMSGAGCPLSQPASGRSSISLPRAGRTLKSLSVYGVSCGTVRKHLDHIYAKLGVHTRTAAVAVLGERRFRSRDS